MHRERYAVSAFTLVEMLLVVAIIGIATIVVLPSFVRSMRGYRLRVACRSVVMAGRYARSMAVMKQAEMTVTFDLDSGTVSVGGRPEGSRNVEKTADQGSTGAVTGAVEEAGGPVPAGMAGNEGEVSVSGGAVQDGIKRTLDGVIISEVEVEGAEEKYTKGTCSVPYHSNGTCTPYKIKIVDKSGESVTVSVDALSSPQTESGTKEGIDVHDTKH